MAESTDRIERQVLLRAPVERVWRAVSDAREFGRWFGASLDGAFAEGARLTARIGPKASDPKASAAPEAHEGVRFEIVVERLEPPRHFSFRWHPYAVDPAMDYTAEPMTLVTFDLEPAPEGTLLTIRESGFDAIPLERRAKAFDSNEKGWAAQAVNLEKYLARAA